MGEERGGKDGSWMSDDGGHGGQFDFLDLPRT